MWATTYSPYQICPCLCPGEDTAASLHYAGKLRLSIQRLQKRGHEEYIGKYSRQLVFSCMRLLVVALRRQYNAKASVNHFETARAASTVKLCASI